MKLSQFFGKGYPIPLAAIVTLTVLLVMALYRLAQTHEDMRNNVGTNMYWAISQAHLESLRLSDAVQRKYIFPHEPIDTDLRYQLLLSRLALLEDGPQARYLQEAGVTEQLQVQFARIRSLEPLYTGSPNVNTATLERTIAALQAFNTIMAETAADSMARQWEEFGARLDHFRNTVMTTIFLMVGILLVSAFLAIKLIVTLKRVRASEQSQLLAAQLEKELEAERKVSELYRNFGAMVSHQFRTPLAIIDSSMQRLVRASDHLTSEEIARRATKVRSAIQRLTQLVESTLSADRLATQTEVSLQQHDLSALAQEAVAAQRSVTPERTLLLKSASPSSTLAHCDPVLTGQILLNLVSNAVKYSPATSPVAIHVFAHNDTVKCTVTDYGQGVAAQDLPHIFDRYYRAPSAANIVGTGIGLHVARQLALLQHGTLEASSAPGVGSTFTLTLPQYLPEATAPGQAAGAPTPSL